MFLISLKHKMLFESYAGEHGLQVLHNLWSSASIKVKTKQMLREILKFM